MRVILMFLSLMTVPAAAANTVHKFHPHSPYKVYAPNHYVPGRDFQLQNTNS